jgi:CRISPR-associated protein Csm4
MPEWTIYTLRPRGALHLGQRGVGQEETAPHVPSDTLFAALVAAWVDAGGRGEEWGSAFPQGEGIANPPFLLTSTFPYAGGVRFYPFPQVDLAPLGVEADERRKDLRQIAYVSEDIFRRIVTGQSLAGYLPSVEGDVDKGAFMQGKAMWLAVDEAAALPAGIRCRAGTERQRPLRALRHAHVFKNVKVPRVTVDRIGSASNLFHSGRVTFAPGCGLWFGVHWRRQDATWPKAFHETLSLLGDSGLGGIRAVGCGALQWEKGEAVSWPAPADGAPYVTLSRYHPRPSEAPGAFSGDTVAYRLTAVAGYLQTQASAAQRRRRLWLAAEGSVLRAVGDGPYGDLADVRPHVGEFPHPVWRYGLASPIAVSGGV